MSENREETLKFGAEVSKILQLMIHSLYTNKDIFLRELISNSSDACDKLRHLALTDQKLIKDDPELNINILIDKNNRQVVLIDNGIGMDRGELVANLGTIAKSGTQEFVAKLTGDKQQDIPLIGQFGVGFYSAFMVASRVDVVSRKAGSDEGWQWSSEGAGEFTVTPSNEALRGTRITLHLKEGEDEFLDHFRLRHIVQTYSDHIAFPIYITDAEGNKEAANSASALWTRPKSDITPEQYHEFYRHVAHQPDEPWLTLHNKAEGKLEYTQLLFIPSVKPFDLFHPDRKRRVKLYVKRVFITDENVDLVPQYLRFMRGIVDSQDLPLNISRETLQHNPLLIKIKESIVKRTFAELKKKSEVDEAGYLAFWKNFGAVMKEGLCESNNAREQILEVCRFASSALPDDTLTSLDAYVLRMKDSQQEIYYLTGDRLESLRGSPQLEGFAKRGIEVLLLSDHVDDFWVNVVFEYKGKKLKSITRSDINLGESSEEKADEHNNTVSPATEMEPLVVRMKAILGDKVQEVRVTSKLDTSPVCLAVREGAMDFRLERFLVEQKQLPATSAKIMEINPNHPIIKSLLSKLSQESMTGELEDIVWLLFDQARIVEGEEVHDPSAFCRRMHYFMQKSLAA